MRFAWSAILACLVFAVHSAEIVLPDIEGKTHVPLAPGSHQATVLIFVSPFCPTSNAFAPEVNRLATDYSGQFAIYLVEADAEISEVDARKHAETLQIKSTLLLDRRQELTRLTGAKATPEAVILSRDGRILYQGRINNLYTTPTRKLKEPTSHDLRQALDAVISSNPISTPATKAIGCSITILPANKSQ